MHSNLLARALSLVTILLSSAIVVALASPPVQEPGGGGTGGGETLQPCDGQAHGYTSGAGSSTASGAASGEEALDAAGDGAIDLMSYLLPACGPCEQPKKCRRHSVYEPSGWEEGDPVYDPLTGTWSATVTWESMDIDSTCRECE